MKTLKKFNKLILLTVVLITLFSFTSKPPMANDELILGTWVFSGAPDSEWQIKADGKCYDYVDGILKGTYTYDLVKEIKNGEQLHVLILININNADEKYEFEINSLNSFGLELDNSVGFRSRIIYFQKVA